MLDIAREVFMKSIQTDSAPAAIGPYSQGVVSNGLLFTSMQLGLDPGTGELSGATAPEQARRCLENVKAIVESAGASLAETVKVTVYLTRIDDFTDINEIYAGFFPEWLPARAVVEVSALPKGALVAVEAIASLS
jgi:2-iminobutanoate/2-iminopropanoate deaminase